MTSEFTMSKISRNKIYLVFLSLCWLISMTNAKSINTEPNNEAIPIDSLEPMEIDKETLERLKNAPTIEL